MILPEQGRGVDEDPLRQRNIAMDPCPQRLGRELPIDHSSKSPLLTAMQFKAGRWPAA
jgi:hypothetical protein